MTSTEEIVYKIRWRRIEFLMLIFGIKMKKTILHTHQLCHRSYMYYKFSIHFLLSTKVHPHCDPNLASVAKFKYDLLDSRIKTEEKRTRRETGKFSFKSDKLGLQRMPQATHTITSISRVSFHNYYFFYFVFHLSIYEKYP